MSFRLFARQRPTNVAQRRPEQLELAELAQFSDLAHIHAVWQAAAAEGPGRRLDPLELPPRLFPYMLMFDLDLARPALRVRLAGERIRDKHGRALVGLSLHELFARPKAERVLATALQVARSGVPDLAYCEYLAAQDTPWTYVRLMLPLEGPQGDVDRIFTVIEPQGRLREAATTLAQSA